MLLPRLSRGRAVPVVAKVAVLVDERHIQLRLDACLIVLDQRGADRPAGAWAHVRLCARREAARRELVGSGIPRLAARTPQPRPRWWAMVERTVEEGAHKPGRAEIVEGERADSRPADAVHPIEQIGGLGTRHADTGTRAEVKWGDSQ